MHTGVHQELIETQASTNPIKNNAFMAGSARRAKEWSATMFKWRGERVVAPRRMLMAGAPN